MIGSQTRKADKSCCISGDLPVLQARSICLAVQCCEHLNRALIMERAAAEARGFETVSVMPQPHAGSSMAVTAWNAFDDPVAEDSIQANTGMDGGPFAVYPVERMTL